MNLGFIGTGEITKAVVKGIINSQINFKKIYISKRNKNISKNLKKKNKNIVVLSDNQNILDMSNWVFLAVTPNVGLKILKKLKFKKSHTIISFISTIKMKKLKELINVDTKIVRAIPLPPIALGKGPVPIYPKNVKVKNFFNEIGECIEIRNENLSLNFWAISSLMAAYYELLSNASKWLNKKGLEKQLSKRYITSLFNALSAASFSKDIKDLDKLVKQSQTPKGLNEQTLKYLKKSGFYNKFNFSLDKILKKLK